MAFTFLCKNTIKSCTKEVTAIFSGNEDLVLVSEGNIDPSFYTSHIQLSIFESRQA